MFARLLVLILVSIVLSAPLFTKTKGTTSFWVDNIYTEDPTKEFFYNDANGIICSTTTSTGQVFEIPFSNTTPILWTGSRVQKVAEYTGGVLTQGTVISYDGGLNTPSTTRYIAFYIKSSTNPGYSTWFKYTDATKGATDSVELASGEIREIPCATNGTEVTCSRSTKVLIANYGDRIIIPQRGGMYFNKYGGFISFWIKNQTATPATFWYNNADSTAQSVAVAANATVEVNYVSLYTNVWIGTATTKTAQYPVFLQKGDLITYSNPPTITTHPQSQTIAVGNSVTFTSDASGQQTITYQWQKNDINITNAISVGGTSTSYTIPSVSLNDGGTYRVIATNSLGADTSNQASLSVVPTAIEGMLLTNNIQWSASPNPFSSEIRISSILNADIDIFSLTGQKVAGFKNVRHVSWKPLNEASGTYIIKVNVGEKTYNDQIHFTK